ncbi:MAG: helix-turn-helix domain-containing protein [Herbinix sp.]|nr:helix-turn-helix domain-containing protein [Herbinix sp.]
MDLGKKIYELRKYNNLTQEQLAKAIGVSTPAVCKWETGVSMPDIALLAPIARKLNTNVNNLLSFKETLTAAEIQNIMNEIKKVARHKGLNAGMDICYQYLRQYPNVDELKLRIAMMPSMMAHTADEEYLEDEDKFQKLQEAATVLLEELMHSEDDTIRMAATACIINKYMDQQRLEEAEAILQKLPKQNFEARHLFPSLYLMKGEEDKVLECLQANMLQDIQYLLGDIMGQHTVYIKNKNYKKALKCAQDYLTLVQIAGTTAMSGNELLVKTYLAMNRIENATKYFLDYIDEIKNINGKYHNTFYFSHIADKVAVVSSDIEEDVRISLYKYILHEERYRVLREIKEVSDKLEQLNYMLFDL